MTAPLSPAPALAQGVVMGPYFHARWYVDHDGLLQRRPPADQQSMEDRLVNDGAALEDVLPDAAHWSADAEASR